MIAYTGQHLRGGKVELHEIHQGIQRAHVVRRALIPHIVRRRITSKHDEVRGKRRRKLQGGVDNIQRGVARVVAPLSSGSRLRIVAWSIVRSATHGVVAVGDGANGIERIPVNVSDYCEISYVCCQGGSVTLGRSAVVSQRSGVRRGLGAHHVRLG